MCFSSRYTHTTTSAREAISTSTTTHMHLSVHMHPNVHLHVHLHRCMHRHLPIHKHRHVPRHGSLHLRLHQYLRIPLHRTIFSSTIKWAENIQTNTSAIHASQSPIKMRLAPESRTTVDLVDACTTPCNSSRDSGRVPRRTLQYTRCATDSHTPTS